jgi:hypothetical protein
MKTVYESALAVDAHMICDLLARTGIPAQVMGEYLQGAAGELPVGGLVRVVVPDPHEAEARRIIDDWERAAPPLLKEAARPPVASRSAAPWWVLLGFVMGVFVSWAIVRTPVTNEARLTKDGVDYDGDGVLDVRYIRRGDLISRVESDRNSDGRIDLIEEYDETGIATRTRSDDDFDSRYEATYYLERGQYVRFELDRDGDGFVDKSCSYTHSAPASCSFHVPGRTTPIKRQAFRAGLLVSDEVDTNGDGTLDRTVLYDALEEPIEAAP